MRLRVAILASCVVSLSGCALSALTHQAAVDHACSEDRVSVVRVSDDSAIPTEVNVCGMVRRYRISGTDPVTGAPVWIDVTDLIPNPSVPPTKK